MRTDREYDFLFRPVRTLIDDGKPPGDVLSLWVGDEPSHSAPLGFITKRNLLCFWPPLPNENKELFGDIACNVDHVTLDVESRRMHITHFDDIGRRQHESGAWKAHRFPQVGLSFWFSMAVRWTVLERHRCVSEKAMFAPPTDAERRKEEFVKYAKSFRTTFVKAAPRTAENKYVYCVAYLIDDETVDHNITGDMFLFGEKHFAIDWDDGVYCAQPTKVVVGDTQLLFVVACPPGDLDGDVHMGFPRTSS